MRNILQYRDNDGRITNIHKKIQEQLEKTNQALKERDALKLKEKRERELKEKKEREYKTELANVHDMAYNELRKYAKNIKISIYRRSRKNILKDVVEHIKRKYDAK